VQRLSDLGPLTAFFFSGLLNLTAEQLTDGKLPADQIRKAFQIATWQFDMLPAWDVAGIEHTLRSLEPLIGAKFRDIVRHFYIAITGSPASVPLFDAMEILGRDLCRERLRAAIATLGGVGIAEAGQWKQEMRGAGATKQPEPEETEEAAE
jgi:glutamyl-tRNA synthetase